MSSRCRKKKGNRGAAQQTSEVESLNGGADPNGDEALICPKNAVTGLKSAAACFGLVELLCYQPFVREYLQKQVPSLRLFGASKYLSQQESTQLFKQGVGLRTLADIVRAQRLLRRGGGWFVDCDCHWMRRLDIIQLRPPQHFAICLPRKSMERRNVDVSH